MSGASCFMRRSRSSPSASPSTRSSSTTSGRASWKRLQASAPEAACADLETLVGQQRPQRLADQRLVIGNQDGRAHQRTTGIRISNTAPRPSVRAAPLMRPPCSRTMFWLTASPRPWPSGLVVKKGLNSSRELPGRDAGPAIGDPDGHFGPAVRRRSRGLDLDGAARRGFGGVGDQVHQRLGHQLRVDLQRGQVGRLVAQDAGVVTGQHRTGRLDGAVDEAAHGDQLVPRRQRARVAHQPPHQPLDARQLAIQGPGRVDDRAAARRRVPLPLQQLHGGLHAGDRVQDLVGQLGRQLTDGGQLLALHQPAPVLEQRGVGLFQPLDDGAHLVSQRLQPGAPGPRWMRVRSAADSTCTSSS